MFNILPCIYRCLTRIFKIWFPYDCIEKKGTWFFTLAYYFLPFKNGDLWIWQLQNFTWYYCWWKPSWSLRKKKKMEKLSSLAIKDQENKDFNKPLGRHVFCFFDKYMIIRMNYMSSNNFPVMWSLKGLPTAIYQY